MANPFAPRSNPTPPRAWSPGQQSQNQNGQDPYDYIEGMLQRSGGDAKAAFYLAAKEKGVDPNEFLKEVQTLGDPRAGIQSMLANNPKAKRLLQLFSLIH